jgi:peptidoglycan-associated lipoprotein
MRESKTLNVSRIGAGLLLLALVFFAAGCKKHIPVAPTPPSTATPNNNRNSNPSGGEKPVINVFTAEPATIERGQSSTLSWSISNATDMSIDHGVGAVQSRAQRQVFPSATTTYTLTANGPGGSETGTVTVEVSTAPAAPPTGTIGNPRLSSPEMLQQQAQDAYFDYNHNDLRPDARDALTHDAQLLKQIFAQEPNFTVVIEGHCDERGSAEYNLALGDKRSTSAKEFLVQLGIPADRIKTISYGKERPQCTDANEGCWQKNRRAHLSAGQ